MITKLILCSIIILSGVMLGIWLIDIEYLSLIVDIVSAIAICVVSWIGIRGHFSNLYGIKYLETELSVGKVISSGRIIGDKFIFSVMNAGFTPQIVKKIQDEKGKVIYRCWDLKTRQYITVKPGEHYQPSDFNLIFKIDFIKDSKKLYLYTIQNKKKLIANRKDIIRLIEGCKNMGEIISKPLS